MLLYVLYVTEVWEKAVSGSWCDSENFNQYLIQELISTCSSTTFDFIITYIVAGL